MEARRRLLEASDIYDQEQTSEDFLEAMRDVVNWHGQQNDFYQKLLDAKGFSSDQLQTEADLAKIPFMHANFFKYYVSLSVPEEQIAQRATSSGTSGQKSQMFFDQDSWDYGQAMVKQQFGYHDFLSEKQTNYLLYTYEPVGENELGTSKTDQGLLQYAPVHDTFFALRYNGQEHEFDFFGTIDCLKRYEKQGLPVRIFGFPSFLYFTLKQMKALKMPPLTLHPDSMTMLGGGWKGYGEQQISKEALYQLVEEMLGFSEKNCRDGYGSTEHSVPYFECSHHQFHIPVYSRLIVRDVKTLEPVADGQPGFANFITPHLRSVPAISVLMGDLVSKHASAECGCGISAPFMKILGRAGTSQAKSCAITASELLKG